MTTALARFSFCLGLLGAACDGKLAHRQEGAVAVSLPIASETRRLAVEVDFGSITVLAAEDGKDELSFEGDCLRAADDAATLQVLAGVDLTLLPSQEGDLLRLRSPSLPPGVDADHARMVVRGVLRCPPRLQVVVRTGRGSLKGAGLGAGVDLATGVGDVAVSGCRGAVEVRTDQGDIMVDGLRGSLEMQAKAGSARAHVAELGDAGIRAHARDTLEVRLPRQAGFVLNARAEHGRCHNSFGLTITMDGARSSMSGDANGGGAKVDLTSAEGTVTVGVTD
ncbi:MAG: hypothetical protein R3F56_22785 [Planctomycetota bacterium]